jgi:hypothetical protein
MRSKQAQKSFVLTLRNLSPSIPGIDCAEIVTWSTCGFSRRGKSLCVPAGHDPGAFPAITRMFR